MMPAGRPTKLTDEVKDQIVSAVRNGNYVETAGAIAGVCKQTLYNWLRKGARSRSGKLREFVDAVNKAISDSQADDVDNLRKYANGYDVVKTKTVVGPDGKVISET